MNILILTPFFPSKYDSTWGNFVYGQCRALRELGHHIVVILLRPWVPAGFSSHKSSRDLKSCIPVQYEWDGIPVYASRSLSPPGFLLWRYKGWLRYVFSYLLFKRLNDQYKFDLVHGHSLVCGDVANRAGQLLKIPSVITIHGVEHAAEVTSSRRSALRRIYNDAKRLIIVGRPLQHWVEKYCYQKEKISVVPNGVTPEWACLNPPVSLSSKDNSQLTILSVSRLDTGKGIKENLLALSSLYEEGVRCIRYWVVGDGHKCLSLKTLCSSLELDDIVKFWGAIDHSEVNRYYAACDIFSLPSWQESFGLTYLEAMLHGKPVIGCKGQGAAETVLNGETGILVAAEDVQGLREALAMLLKDEDLRQRMGQRGREHVLDNFTWRYSAEQLLRVYEQLI